MLNKLRLSLPFNHTPMKQTILLFTICLFSLQAFSQYQFEKPKWNPATPYRVLYVFSEDTSTQQAKAVLQAIRASWNVTPVKVISVNQLDANLIVPGNIFVNPMQYTIVTQNDRGGGNYGEAIYNDYYYLNFWTVEKEYNPKKDIRDNMYMICRAELFMKMINQMTSDFKKFEITAPNKSIFLYQQRKGLRETTFDITSDKFGYDYVNGMSGGIKNTFQEVNRLFKENKPHGFFDEVNAPGKLSMLKKDTLFIANIWFGSDGTIFEQMQKEEVKFNKKLYDQSVQYINDLFKSYPYPYKLVSREELNARIIDGNNNMYYLNYIQSSADKFLSVVNGKTGEILYTSVEKRSYRLKTKDFENIAAAVGK